MSSSVLRVLVKCNLAKINKRFADFTMIISGDCKSQRRVWFRVAVGSGFKLFGDLFQLYLGVLCFKKTIEKFLKCSPSNLRLEVFTSKA